MAIEHRYRYLQEQYLMIAYFSQNSITLKQFLGVTYRLEQFRYERILHFLHLNCISRHMMIVIHIDVRHVTK